MSVWLVRHTRVAIAPGVCYGRLEVPLAATFAAEAAAVRLLLPARIEAVVTSPAERCRRLARELADEVREDPRLRELDFGAWEGLRWTDFRSPESEAWAADPWQQRPPGGESGEEMEARVAEARREIEATAQRRTVVVVTHGGVIRAWRRAVSGDSRDASMAWDVPCGGVWRVLASAD